MGDLKEGMDDSLRTVTQIAKVTKLREATIRKYCRMGLLKAVKPKGGKNWLILSGSVVEMLGLSQR